MAEEHTAAQTQETDAAEAAETAQNPAMEGSRTYTQEEFEAQVKEAVTGAVRERIDRANAKHQAEAEESAARIAELEKAAEEAQRALDAANGELDGYRKREQQQQWAQEVAAETGVPADVLRGDTKEEMEAHAAAVKPHFETPSAPFVASDGFAAENKGKDPDWLRAALTNKR